MRHFMFDLLKVKYNGKEVTHMVSAFAKVKFRIQNTVLMHDTRCPFISAIIDM